MAAGDLLADDSLPGWRGHLLRMGARRSVALITVVSLLLSVGTVLVNRWLGDPSRWATDLLVAILVPLIVAPLASSAGMRLLAEVEAARRALREVAIRDGLTGLFTRGYFLTRLDAEVRRAQRDASPLSVLLLDIDRFKAINDTCGHAIGDAVLQREAVALAGQLRPQDLAAHFGGEEFVALLPGVAGPDATAIADAIRRALDTPDPMLDALASGLHVTASIGIASLGPAPDAAEPLLRRADLAMYDAKRNGRNRCVTASTVGNVTPLRRGV
ncbi:MAG: GGDEF domain-containing protein [Xanthomonadaceae bacterium]|jgi:two-component system cell cycle response regulator|nr:GGDEF domain-containing protein [Xanthomonadaceae bacterium]